MTVELLAHGSLVARKEIPPFDPVPTVLVWGVRTFTFFGTDTDGVALYAEVFGYTIFDVAQPS